MAHRQPRKTMANTELTRAHIDLTDRQIDQLEELQIALSARTRNETIRRAIGIALQRLRENPEKAMEAL